MNGGLVIAAAAGASAALFVLWSWAMDRLDAREVRREAERLRRQRPPVLGGAPHRRRADRRGR